MTGHTEQHEAGELADALEKVIGCFEAARIEGLTEQLAAYEAEPGNLVDLVKRRLAYAEFYAADALKVWNTRTRPTPAPDSEAVDSGMAGPSVERAELFWANLPTGRSWTSLATHEKALVCHSIDRLIPLPTPNTEPAGGSEAKYADMSVEERAVAMADDGVGDPWELLGYFREKLRQAEERVEEVRESADKLIAHLRAKPHRAGGSEAWRTDDCRATGDYSDDPVEQLVFELSWELEEAALSATDYVTVNRDKLHTIAERVLARRASTAQPAGGWQQEQVEAVRDAADLLHGYGEYIAQVHSSELERHPYLPAVEDVIARLRALAALTQPSGERPESVTELIEILDAAEPFNDTAVFDHTPEEIGEHVMAHYKEIRATLAGDIPPNKEPSHEPD